LLQPAVVVSQERLNTVPNAPQAERA